MKEIRLHNRNLMVSADGRVFSERGQELSQYEDVYGYKYIVIRTDQKLRQKMLVHRLVAKAYLPNNDDTLQVNHKDGVKTNNHFKNLEWCTNSENQMHSRYVLDNQTGFKDVAVLCVETQRTYRSTREAWRETGINYCHISECINGKRKSAGGFRWERM